MTYTYLCCHAFIYMRTHHLHKLPHTHTHTHTHTKPMHTHTHTHKCTLSISCTDRHTYTLHAQAPKDLSVNKSYQWHRHQTLPLPYIVIIGLVDWAQDIKLVTYLLITGHIIDNHTHTLKSYVMYYQMKRQLSAPHLTPTHPLPKIQKQKPTFKKQSKEKVQVKSKQDSHSSILKPRPRQHA